MSLVNAMSTFATSAGWESLSSAGNALRMQYQLGEMDDTLGDCFVRPVPDHGSLGVFWPRKFATSSHASAPQFCSVFSGYTGDPFTHQKFIRHALDRNIGVICVRISHGPSIRDMLLSTATLYVKLTESKLPLDRINFVRAISFGSYLSLYWIQKLKNHLNKVALFAPCSAKQLPKALSKIGMSVQSDGDLTVDLRDTAIDLRAYYLANDSVVGDRDPLFAGLTRNVTSIFIREGDHFSIDDTNEATKDVAEWFAGNVG